MNFTDSSQDESIQLLTAILRDSTLSRLKTLSKRPGVRLFEIPTELVVYDHWMSIILISGKSLKLTLKMHFNSDAGRFFAAIPYNREPSAISESAATSFFAELANFVAGQIKEIMADNSVEVSVSLPILARGFDEVFYARSPQTLIRYWQLVLENYKVCVSAHIELLEKVSFNKIRMDDAIVSGDVDFL